MGRNIRKTVLEYGFAVVAVAIASLLRWYLSILFGPIPIFVTLYPAVLLVAAVGGAGAGILASVLAAVAADYYFLPPYGFGIESINDIESVAIFTASNVFLCLLMARMRRANWERAVSATRAALLRKANEELEQHVYERTARIRALALELTRTEQRERKRLALILHDHLQQLLVGAKYHLEAMRGRAGGERLAGLIGETQKLLDEAIVDSRSLAVELAPPVLGEAGLVAALEWLSRWTEQNHGLRVEVEAGDGEIAPDKEGICLLLFQCVRELLFNTIKHGRTHEARVALRRDGGRVRIVVQDEGAGFDPAVVGPGAGGFGLGSIRERMSLVGGSMEIDSAPGRGTRVTLSAPLPE